jgi:beta-phosphoglucomutase-like phosphatase (HAD superfamily)
LKKRGIKIGLVTSGLYEKAWPEIMSAFQTLEMEEKAEDFYDASITAGFPLKKGNVGTLGELSPKPHPWLYAEVARVGLGIPFEDRNHVLGIEDSGAGVVSIKLAGFPTVGIGGGNIEQSGTKPLCDYYCNTFEEILKIID